MNKHIIAWTCLFSILAALLSGCGASGSAQTEPPQANPSSQSSSTVQDVYTVYVLSPGSWDDVRIWAWSAAGDLFEAWPGEAMFRDKSGWYSYTVPKWVDNVIISSNGGSIQTADLNVTPQDLWILINDDGSASVSYTDPAAQAQWNDAVPQQEGYYKVYAKVDTGWSDVAVWAWSETLGDLVPEWPGVLMEMGPDGWYVMDIPVEYDNVIINGNGGTAQTSDLYTGGSSVWITVDATGEDMYFSKPSGSAAPNAPAGTGSAEYDQVFRSRGISDLRVVSGGLNLIAGVKVDGDAVQKMEYGYSGNTTEELAIVVYFDITGMSDSDVQTARQWLQEAYADASSMPFCNTSCERTGNYLRYIIYFQNLSNSSNAQLLAAYIGAGSSGLTSDGKIPVPTAAEMQSLGMLVKVG